MEAKQIIGELEQQVKSMSKNLMLKPASTPMRLCVAWMKTVEERLAKMEAANDGE
ncbi:hypothetical protein [Vibrio sp. qd031]|uniref:hypothetical protein n=1 Tax=Vibrio sp. qd031 TaxID=1603038 RepID=UPI001552BE32|nr:hypothetical protein [Vibrio sp. qd031]